jgi:conjugative transfer region protein TrbK
MRGRPFRNSRIVRGAGYSAIAIAMAIAAAGIHLRHQDMREADWVRVPVTTTDPLAAELARCQAIAMAAKDGAACESAWAENRRRFFTYRPADSASAPRTADPKPMSKPGEQ